jgi:tRNA uridine 5-carboxymethylaminomethyl modification enzyme
VVGGGHAGCEAFAASCRVGASTAMIIPELTEAAMQPCNPAVGGPGKGHLVREVVALGGLMGRITDGSGLQFRTLNRKKGPAVRATRVQTDSGVYSQSMSGLIKGIEGGEIIEDRAVGVVWSGQGSKRKIEGIQLDRGGFVGCQAVVIATGTFLRGLLFTGDKVSPGGRQGASPAVRLALSLEKAGLPMMRLKTGTCPRLAGDSIDVSKLEKQPGDTPPPFFDPETRATVLKQLTCHLTYTNDRTHEVVRRNLDTSALFSGAISGIGPRYCPSIETKISQFPDKDRHQVFLEPETENSDVVYPSGLATSLSEDAQEEMIHAIPGLEKAKIVRYGYAVEYDAVQPRDLSPSLELDGFEGLFLAGQVLGTSGYEEAAALGLLAGANAARTVLSESPLVIRRNQAYAGVMIDDLTTRGIDEPYRMFTSRAEYRLLLREDNADDRLAEIGVDARLISPDRAATVREKLVAVSEATEGLRAIRITPSKENNIRLADAGLPKISKLVNLIDLLRRNDVQLGDLAPLAPWVGDLSEAVAARIEVDTKYSGYLERQQIQAERLSKVDHVRIPQNIDYASLPGLRPELVEKLQRVKPADLGQAGRIPGITPAAVQILHVFCDRTNKRK